MSGPRRSDFAVYRRLMLEARRFWPHVGVLFALSLLAVPLTLLTPLPLKIVVDSVLGPHDLPAWVSVLLPAQAAKSDWIAILLMAGLIVLLALGKHLVELLFLILRSYTAEQLVLRSAPSSSPTCSGSRCPITTRPARRTRSTASSTMRPPSNGS